MEDWGRSEMGPEPLESDTGVCMDPVAIDDIPFDKICPKESSGEIPYSDRQDATQANANSCTSASAAKMMRQCVSGTSCVSGLEMTKEDDIQEDAHLIDAFESFQVVSTPTEVNTGFGSPDIIDNYEAASKIKQEGEEVEAGDGLRSTQPSGNTIDILAEAFSSVSRDIQEISDAETRGTTPKCDVNDYLSDASRQSPKRAFSPQSSDEAVPVRETTNTTAVTSPSEEPENSKESPATPAGDSQAGNTEANLLLHMYNTVREENNGNLEKSQKTSSSNINNDESDQSSVDKTENISVEEGIAEVFPKVDVEAGLPFRMQICKALESVCRKVFLAKKFVHITGDLHFSIDDVEAVRMPVVNYFMNVVSDQRGKRGRPRKNKGPVRRTNFIDSTVKQAEPELVKVPEEVDIVLPVPAEENTPEPETPEETTYECQYCKYTTRHAGFYKKHLRTKHFTAISLEKKARLQPPRKRGRPRKSVPQPVIEDQPPPEEAQEVCLENDLHESASDTGDNEDADATFQPEAEVNEEDPENTKRSMRSSGSGKFSCDQCAYETDHSGHYRDHLNRHKGVKPHQCPLCFKSFIRLDDLKKHEEIHMRKYECTMCSAQFADRGLLKEHMKSVHNETGRLQLFPCEICKKNLPTHAELAKHMDSKHNYICSICGESFTYVMQLKKHKNTVHPKESLTCPQCLKTCASKGALRKHMHRHRAGTSFPCDICNRSFTAQSTLYHHKRGVHSDLKPYKCDKCDKRFNFHHSLKLHVLQHDGVRPYKCDVCEKTYLTATHLKSHKQAVHSDMKKYVCVICNKRFPYENSLKMHMMLHTGDRPFLCNICGRGFINHSALKTHEASHVDSKEWQCDICKKMYKTEALMRAHRRRHTTEGSRFMCDICGHTFMYKSNLEAHYTVHSDERNYNCKECGCTFKTAATLYSHRLVHKTDTPHHCSICSKAFKSKERKLAHEKRHLGDKPFQCEICGRNFPDKGGLSKHSKTVHSKVKRFVCPVCKKTCSRADNLRVHMRIHRDPSLLKLNWKALMTNDMEEDTADGDLFSNQAMGQQPQEQGQDQGQQMGIDQSNSSGAMGALSGSTVNAQDVQVHLGMTSGESISIHALGDQQQPCDLRQPADMSRGAVPHQHRHPGHHLSHHHQATQHAGVLVVPDPSLSHHLHPSLQASGAGTAQQPHHLLIPSLTQPPPAHHQQATSGLQTSGQEYDTLCPTAQESLRTIRVVMPPAAHSGGEDGGAQAGVAPLAHSMREYTEHAMLFMQYQNQQ